MNIQRFGLLMGVAFGSVLWGSVELVALQRARLLRWRLRL
jgi:hypothetical protein